MVFGIGIADGLWFTVLESMVALRKPIFIGKKCSKYVNQKWKKHTENHMKIENHTVSTILIIIERATCSRFMKNFVLRWKNKEYLQLCSCVNVCVWSICDLDGAI